MTAQITHLPANSTLEELLQCMAEDGAVIIDDVLSGAQLEAIDNDLARTKKKCMAATRSPVSIRNALAHSLRALSLWRTGAGATRAVYRENLSGGHCDDVQLHFTSAVAIAPGESAQILHRDRGIWGGYVPRQIEPLFSTIWALTPFTRENGATQVVVGSHRWDKKRQRNPMKLPTRKCRRVQCSITARCCTASANTMKRRPGSACSCTTR